MLLIDAEELEEKAVEFANGRIYVPIERIWEAPAVDAVEVVRCKDCKHFRLAEDGIKYCKRDKLGASVFMRNADFCSYGKRREDG